MFYYLTNSELNKTSAVIGFGGPDANTYLQGQFTQEINRPGRSVGYGLFLNQKGKVVADGHLLRLENDGFWLISHSSPAPKLRERLEAYIIADEVDMEDRTSLWARIRLWGDEAGSIVAKVIGMAPEPGFWVEARSIRAFCGRCARADNFELILPHDMVSEIGAELVSLGGLEATDEVAERARIVSGIPSVPADIGLNDLPNEGGLDEVAISYTKGCYLGQEVMARLKNLGQVRRRLHVVRGAGLPLAPGTPLFQEDKRVGDLRSAARDGEGFVAMAMLSLVTLNPSMGLSLIPNGPTVISIIRRV